MMQVCKDYAIKNDDIMSSIKNIKHQFENVQKFEKKAFNQK